MWAWHCHHKELLERLVASMDERRDYIRDHKTLEERTLRLKLFKKVRGKLPKELLKAGRDCDKVLSSFEYKEIFQKCLPKINRLHKKECPNCPWDGKTIFPQGGRK